MYTVPSNTDFLSLRTVDGEQTTELAKQLRGYHEKKIKTKNNKRSK